MLCARLVAGDVSELRQFEENNRIFEMRRVLEQPGWNESETVFYRAVIEARFGHEAGAIGELQKVLANRPDPQMERRAYEELAGAFERLERYGDAAQAFAEALRFTPKDDYDRRDTENTEALDEALRDVAPQTAQLAEDATVQGKQDGLGSWNVPVEINGKQGEWIFDTGANQSTITESEATRMGLTVRETGTYVRGSTGAKNPLRVAVAQELHFGTARFSNVVFLVLKDEALNIVPMKIQIRGLLGLPVIRALGRVEISSKGAIRIEGQKPAGAAEPNLCFDELSLLLEARHDGHSVQMFLDTGANASLAYPSFRAFLSKDEIADLTKKREQTAGAGGTIKRTAETIPTLRLELMGHALDIPKVTLIAKQPKGDMGKRDGVVGMDGLTQDFALDFRTMQLTVQ